MPYPHSKKQSSSQNQTICHIKNMFRPPKFRQGNQRQETTPAAAAAPARPPPSAPPDETEKDGLLYLASHGSRSCHNNTPVQLRDAYKSSSPKKADMQPRHG